MAQLQAIDRVLREATDRGDVPGVVAMAATRDGPVYQGAFGRRALPDGVAMTARYRVPDRVDDESDHFDGSDAARRTGKAGA